jgi:glucoamylase
MSSCHNDVHGLQTTRPGAGQLAGDAGAAAGRLASMAGAANEGSMIPEQVWDENRPAGQPGFAGRPVEQPGVVACRYAGC